MINHYLHINRVFREQVQKSLGCYFSTKTMKAIRYCLLNKNTYVMALIMIYENSGKGIRKVYRVLSCVVYTLIDNYVCIYYLSCQPKTLCGISKIQHLKKNVSIYYLVLVSQNCYWIYYLLINSWWNWIKLW